MVIDLTPQITQAQIAFFLGVVALGIVYFVFYREPKRPRDKKKKR